MGFDTVEDRRKHIYKLEEKQIKYELKMKVEAAKQASREQAINLAVAFSVERSRLIVLAAFGL